MLLVFEAFSGIGAQHKALSNLKKRDKDFKFQIINTCDWYVDAIFGYVAIHKLDRTKKYLKYFNQDIKKIKKYVLKQNFSLDSKKPTNISNKSETFLRKVYACSKVSNNLIDIKTIDETFLKKVNWNLITYSFPCQDLSIAGKNRGMEKGSNTNSSILWEIERILLSLKSLNKLPKFLLMENVIAITYKTNKGQLEKFKKFLKSLNYTSYEFILNALDHNIPQNRKRFFLLSILDKNDNYSLIVKKRPLTTKPKDFINIEELEKTNRDNLYLENIKKQLSNITERERERVYQRTYKNLNVYPKFNQANYVHGINVDFISTITYSGENSRQRIFFEKENKLFVKQLSGKHNLKLMGFDEDDYQNLINYGLNNEQIRKLAGNSIVVNVLEDIFIALNNYIKKIDWK